MLPRELPQRGFSLLVDHVIFLSIKTHAMNTITTFSRNAAKGEFVAGMKPSRIRN
jgi:hypothetical protein